MSQIKCVCDKCGHVEVVDFTAKEADIANAAAKQALLDAADDEYFDWNGRDWLRARAESYGGQK